MGDLYVIRHAQASFGEPNYDRLSTIGFRQASLLEEYLAQLGIRFHSVFSGAMQRHVDTARALLSRLVPDLVKNEINILPEFNEYDAASLVQAQIPHLVKEDPSLEDDLKQIYSETKAIYRVLNRAVLHWISAPDEDSGLETWAAFTGRVRQGIARVLEEAGRGKTIALVTSGGPVSALLQMALSLSDPETIHLAWQLRNASVSIFKYNHQRLTLSSFNSVAHLERKNIPDLITYR
jgi:broad specificity phosphatase PhoE